MDGGAEPAILTEFGKASVVRAINQYSSALGSRSQWQSAGTNNNDLWHQSAHTVKETKSLLEVASGLTRLRCLARVLRVLTHETGCRFQQETEQLRTWKHSGALVQTCLYTTLEAPEHDFNVPNGDIMMEAHMRRTGLVDSAKAFT